MGTKVNMNVTDHFNSLLETFNELGALSYIFKNQDAYYLAYWEKAKWKLSSPIQYIDTENTECIHPYWAISSRLLGAFNHCDKCGQDL